ncbi:B9 domain-containing protein 2-like [Daphnia carinata]|uniref:B9 domain-containing protein 2-like n=1 Tax=Daphnia carinata TaxID=120202 RepID=UPI00257DD3B0|nr:B9 domain-containing protein 2-like [Daphnia carinata]
MAELHLIGQIIGGTEFSDKSIFCRWQLSSGNNWRVLEGATEGQTQLDTPQIGSLTNWNHPLDVHWATRGLQGWPQIHLQIYHLDGYSRTNLIGYASASIPTRPGIHYVDAPAWRPLGTFTEELMRHFIGGGIELTDADRIQNGADRSRLKTEAAGKVHLEIGLIFRDFKKFGIEY